MYCHVLNGGEGRSSAELAFLISSLFVIGYALLAGFRSLTEFDLGWLLATGRWIVEHHQIPSMDVFSYTAQGQPWVYPAGSALLLYLVYLIGGAALISWCGAAMTALTTALLLRRQSLVSALLAVVAVPLIAIRTRPRADMFTVVLFAACFTLLWGHYQTGRGRLWLLPVIMVAWVNLHLGFVAGLLLAAAYVLVEVLEVVRPGRRRAAVQRLRDAGPWLVATYGATLMNPWGWEIYRAVLRQQEGMAAQLQRIPEWGAASLNWTIISTSLSLRAPGGSFILMLLVAAGTVLVAVSRKEFGAAVLVTGAAAIAVEHIRFEALFAVVAVVVGSTVLKTGLTAVPKRFATAGLGPVAFRTAATSCAALFIIALSCLRSVDLVSDRSYLASSDLGSFGTGWSWWFPERAAAFLERENIPGQIFNTYNEGGYFIWQLGSKYSDYVDGRAIPFGPRVVERNDRLLVTPPDSPEWQQEAERYNINAILVPLGRYNGLHLFPVLRQFCASEVWPPVYLDEVSAIFLRRTPETEHLLAGLKIRCAAAPLPAVAPQGSTTAAFNHWANAAAVLQALGRNDEALDATERALAIFPDSAFVHSLRGNLFAEVGSLREAEQEFLQSSALEPNGTTWSSLAVLYHRQRRLAEEIAAWKYASALLPYPAPELLALGYAELAARRPEEALRAFDKAVTSLPPQREQRDSQRFSASLAQGRALALRALGQQR